jgi:hypothetical protein
MVRISRSSPPSPSLSVGSVNSGNGNDEHISLTRLSDGILVSSSSAYAGHLRRRSPPPRSYLVRFLSNPWVISVVGFVLLIVYYSSETDRQSDRESPYIVTEKQKQNALTVAPEDINVVDGEITIDENGSSQSVAYYHCQSPDPPVVAKSKKKAAPPRRFDLVLLHGASMTRENWKKAGILPALCANSAVVGDDKSIPENENILLPGVITVTALDLDVTATHTQLRSVLEALGQQGLVHLPVTTLVSPSASGFTVMDWIRAAHATHDAVHNFKDKTGVTDPAAATFDDMDNHFASWIPIACPAILGDNTDGPLQALRLWNVHHQEHHHHVSGQRPLEILAVYGSNDKMGLKSSQRLHLTANARVQEIADAQHAAYLNQPNAFVQAVRAFLIQENVGVPLSKP